MSNAPQTFDSPTPSDSPLPETGRTLVLCFDGTAKYFNDGNTNVVRLFEGLDKLKSDRQLCYYQPGIGTYVSPTKPVGHTVRHISKTFDMALAVYLEDHIMGGYRFLMENYTEGDRICLFGFSRGAYTARCLAGMLHVVGLLPRGNEEQIPFAYAEYEDDSPEGVRRAHGFKKTFSRHVDIEFMGIWDCVTSVGVAGRMLPFTSNNAVVKVFRQALALDERRAKFRHNPWTKTPPTFSEDPPEDPSLSRRTTETSKNSGEYVAEDSEDEAKNLTLWEKVKRFFSLTRWMNRKNRVGPDKNYCDCNFDEEVTDDREVWFAGSHSDVGGGESPNEEKYCLANPSLLWMIQQIQLTNPGIVWARDAFQNIPTIRAYLNLGGGSPGGHTRHGSGGTPDEEDVKLQNDVVLENLRKDMEDKVHDCLRGFSFWWLLECIPLWKHFLTEEKERMKKLHINFGGSRVIQHETPKFHISVKIKREVDLQYKPCAQFEGDPEYVTW